MMLLEIKNISKQFKRNKKAFYALNQVNLKVDAGDFVCILGSSGSGKSTLLNIATGLLKPTEGTVTFEGKELIGKSLCGLDQLRGSKIGYVMQGQNLLANFNILDNMLMPGYFSGKQNLKQRSIKLLEGFGLIELIKMYPGQLSGGELKRAAIVRSIVSEPALIFADEPTGNLDPDNAVSIMRLFQRLSQEGIAVIVSTHDYEFLKYSKIAYKLTGGKLEEYSN
ncbi:ABC transporter ATP-binding protein [Anaerocolumna sp. AGMB13025]|uniref:ABC transporter ATP-binding protein n=1 Tax=Anaerocolumna sp. AGMB13025 TaxID=3039116 RepID=UPI00241CDAEE|nr:ABC transporter ATP-binding protein [Anaerocolumna sp. AGMB13025]WFR54768.1 ABC transporter ATP-binding protein [Anaerocolumna sp. AGMB13025]